MNEYFVAGSTPAPNSPGSSAVIRAQFTNIASAFDKLPIMAGNANEFVTVDATGTSLVASGAKFSDFVTLDGIQTLTNKTLVWTNNSISTIPVAGGGTGATDLAGAQVALGIDLKADANDAVLTGAPTCPTPATGNSSARIANTQFVTATVAAIGATAPSNAIPLMNGVASAGVDPLVSRDDHIHPVDTSRAPSAASTAAGTSFAPTGGIAANNVQAALVELDTEKAPLASPTFTGNPTAPTQLTSDNDTSIATTAFVQALLAQQPPGVQVSNSIPLVNGVAAAGTGVEASRYDHIHPVDTSRAPSAASTAAGTSFAPTGGIAANNVQAALVELDTEKAPLASPTFTGPVTAPQYYNVTQPYGALQVNGVDAFRFGGDNSGQLAGFRNVIINGNFQIKQRAYVSGAAVGTNLYGHDRWKMAASADTYTFSTALNVTTVTIPAGKVLQQVVEGVNLQSGTYTLSWQGTAQGKIGAGAYGASGVTGVAVGGTNLTIEFGPGTVSKVQLEFGSVPSTFENRPIGPELSLCQRYYQRVVTADGWYRYFPSSGAFSLASFTFPVMRAAPTASIPSYSLSGVATAPTITANSVALAKINVAASGPGEGGILTNVVIELSSEL